MLGNETKELEAAWETGRTLMARLLVLTYIYLKENTMHLVVRKSSRAERVEYLLLITPSHYLSQKLHECSLTLLHVQVLTYFSLLMFTHNGKMMQMLYSHNR